MYIVIVYTNLDFKSVIKIKKIDPHYSFLSLTHTLTNAPNFTP